MKKCAIIKKIKLFPSKGIPSKGNSNDISV